MSADPNLPQHWEVVRRIIKDPVFADKIKAAVGAMRVDLMGTDQGRLDEREVALVNLAAGYGLMMAEIDLTPRPNP